jgi:hypothetical protein
LEKRLQRRPASAPDGAIPRRKDPGPCLLSFSQQRLWFLEQLTPGTSTYNAPFAVHLDGPLNLPALGLAVDAIFARHEVLRTCYDGNDGIPLQCPIPASAGMLRWVDLRDIPEERRAARARQLIEQEAQRPFDLARDPSLRCTLLQLGEHEFAFLHVAHHVAWDHPSKGILYAELGSLYEAFAAGRAPTLTELPIQYGDFAVWQRQHLAGPPLEKLVGFWKGRLAGAPPKLDIPTDRPRPRRLTLRGAKYPFVLCASLLDAAHALSRQAGTTPFATFLAAFKAFLSCYAGQHDVVVGSPISGRDRPEIEPLIGFFINTLVLRTDLSGRPTFRELLGRVRETTVEALVHQDMPFEKLVEIVRPLRDLSRNPLFQVNFRVAFAAAPELRLPAITSRPMPLIDTATSKFDLALEIAGADATTGYWEYSTDLFEEITIARMADDFRLVLAGVLARPETPLPDVPELAEVVARVRRRDKGQKQPGRSSIVPGTARRQATELQPK